MATFRKKPVVVEAWPVKFLNEMAATDGMPLPCPVMDAYKQGGWVFGALHERRRGIFVPTLEGSLFAAPDDWIIRGIKGEFYPCKPDIFAATYEAAADDQMGAPKEGTRLETPDLADAPARNEIENDRG